MKAVLFDFFGVVADTRMAFIGEPGEGSHRLIIHESVTDAAVSLRRRGVRTALVSNFDRTAFFATASHLPVDEWFDAVVFSSDVGAEKPDARIFHRALLELAAEPEDAFFFDDLTRNVDAAVALGMGGHVVGDPREVAEVIDGWF